VTRWCPGWWHRHTLTVILLIVGAGTLQGCMYDPSGPQPAYGGHFYVAPPNDRGGGGGGSEGGGMK
jgi:hypothetical protein